MFQPPFSSGRLRTVRVLGLTLVALALMATSASAAMPVGGAAGAATPSTAGARPARLKITLSLRLRCAKPGPAAIVVSLPRAWRVPKAVARAAVWIDSSHPRAVTVSQHTVTLEPVAPTGTCNVIALGTIAVKFTRAAKLGNPRKAGRYTIHASIGAQTFSAPVSIKP
jgi:hypothetical protein